MNYKEEMKKVYSSINWSKLQADLKKMMDISFAGYPAISKQEQSKVIRKISHMQVTFEKFIDYFELIEHLKDEIAFLQGLIKTFNSKYININEELNDINNLSAKPSEYNVNIVVQKREEVMNDIINYANSFESDKTTMFLWRHIQMQHNYPEVEKYIKAVTKIEEYTEQAKKILDDAKIKMENKAAKEVANKAAKIGGDFFRDEAEKHRTDARFYFRILLLVTVSAIGLYLAYSTDTTNIKINNLSELIIKENLLVKAAIFTLLLMVINLLKNIYLAHKHQQTLHTHRDLALKTQKNLFNAIVETSSQSEREIQNAMLLELTKAIYGANSTGFIKNQAIESNDSKILEISRTISKG